MKKKENYEEELDFMDANGMFREEREAYQKEIAWKCMYYGTIIICIVFAVFAVCVIYFMFSNNKQARILPIEPENVECSALDAIYKERVSMGQQLGLKTKIDGYDFTPYNSGEEGIRDVMDNLNYDSPRFLVSAFYTGIIAVVPDGKSYNMKEECGHYIYFLYLPRKEKEVEVDEEFVTLNTIISHEDNGDVIKTYAITLLHGEEVLGKIPIKAHITYEDGTEETISIKVKKNYVS